MHKKLAATVMAVLIAANMLSVPVCAGWEQDTSAGWRYLLPDQTTAKGWQLLDGEWYFFNTKGRMLTGWQYLGEDWYYLDRSGAMKTGWVKTGEKWYYLDRNGAMKTGFVHDGNSWYYLDENGAWTEDDPEEHQAVSDTGKIITLRNGLLSVDGILIANKSYPLPADYAPGTLTSETMAAFQKLAAGASAAGHSIWIASGYRSYSYQDGLYRKYVNRDGKAAADRYSARAGYSEHQTGLAFDVNQVNSSFAGTPEAKWLAEHAHEYGFIIRYPEEKENVTGYQYEPWHLRYLGVETAKAVYESGLCLEEYLGISSYYLQ
ncbi:MAG: D-alanyl-D-alanine carboxypeptidase family protein [Candidatus Merdivicinus sp.]|jgi:D-alanyl-D-alanine carboxypeptidase